MGDDIRNIRLLFLEEISKITGISINEIKRMDMHEIEERLDLRDCPPCEGLYKFVSRNQMKHREDKITKILEEYKKEKEKNNG